MNISRLAAAMVLGTIALHAQSAVIGTGYDAPYPLKVAPGQLVTIFVSGIGATLKSRISATSLPLPYSLAGISVTIDELMNPPTLNHKVPILAVGPTEPINSSTVGVGNLTAITVQIPFGLRTSSFISPLIPPPATLTVHENDAAAVTVVIAPMDDQVHIATTCDANLTTPVPGAPCRPVVAHADGSLVTRDQPAHAGELLVLYAFGLGGNSPGVVAGDAAPSNSQPVTSRFTLSFEAVLPISPSERLSIDPVYAGLTAGFAGLYQINFFAPKPPLPFFPGACATFQSPNGNVAVTVFSRSSVRSADTASFCIYP